ncbi:MAG TPA: MmgE/PrpD family protein [Streptosporangiaceae bacterium]|nr:MmgE/PrpD family protein [Streptosporangiaceae bacterium]
MTSVAMTLAEWAAGLNPDPDDLDLAHRSLLDTVAVTLAAREHRVARLAAALPDGARWAVAGHVLDFDDLHMPSTTHVSVVCVPTALATGGGARSYLAAAGVMARLGTALGWRHYSAGWHATCTAGAPAAAAGAAVALGLPAKRIAAAMALAVPAAGGVQRAFGTDAKSLQVGFAVEAGIRAARLAAAGAQADPSALDAWLGLVGGDPSAVDPSGPAVPNGLAIKLYPCCYALQRPISALAELSAMSELRADPAAVRRIVLRTPEATVLPLIHHRPQDGLQGKFSLEYAAAAALLDEYAGFGSFTDDAVRREDARRLTSLVETKLDPGGDWLLDGELEAEVHLDDGTVLRTRQQYPPGSPARPPTPDQLAAKLADCISGLETDPASWTWGNAATTLRRYLP